MCRIGRLQVTILLVPSICKKYCTQCTCSVHVCHTCTLYLVHTFSVRTPVVYTEDSCDVPSNRVSHKIQALTSAQHIFYQVEPKASEFTLYASITSLDLCGLHILNTVSGTRQVIQTELYCVCPLLMGLPVHAHWEGTLD